MFPLKRSSLSHLFDKKSTIQVWAALFLILAVHVCTRAIEAYKDGDKIYINVGPVEDGFDLNGVNLLKYDIKLEDDTIYLMSNKE